MLFALGVSACAMLESERQLFEAAKNGQTDRVKVLLDVGTDANAQDSTAQWRGRTPLHWASAAGHLQVAELLLSRGGDVSAVDASLATPLHLAGKACKAQVVRVLLGAGAVQPRSHPLAYGDLSHNHAQHEPASRPVRF